MRFAIIVGMLNVAEAIRPGWSEQIPYEGRLMALICSAVALVLGLTADIKDLVR